MTCQYNGSHTNGGSAAADAVSRRLTFVYALEVAAHIAAGKLVTRLGMTWNDRISFVLTDKLHLKRLAFLDVLKEQAEKSAEGADELFDADFALMAGELAQLFEDLLVALGGEQKPA